MSITKIHKGWFILGISVLNMLACLGFGRFSLGAIIPFMKAGLDLNYHETGLIASSIFFGYLISAISIGYIVNRYSAKQVIIFCLIILAFGMFATVVAFNFWTAYLFCFLIGLGAGGANVTSVSLIGKWFAPKYRGMALGITNSGSGMGIVLSGLIVPLFIMMMPLNGWRLSWLVLGVSVTIIILINLWFLKNSPEEVGLKPIGETKETLPNLHSNMTKKDNPLDHIRNKHVYRDKTVWAVGLIYLAWGFSYLIFSTFFVDFLINDVHFDKKVAGRYFAFAGLVSILSGFIWGAFSDRIGRMYALFWVLFLQATILLLFSLSHQTTFLFIGTLIYGLTLWAVPTVMVAAVSELVNMKVVTVAIGFVTLFFGIGQFISPIVTGYLVELYQTYSSAFLVSSLVCFLASIGSLVIHFRQKKQTLLPMDTIIKTGSTYR
ncbi:nitrate/nitrite transporter [Anaerobacillus sp. MEB173]|uniref:MFS transporter n=1 Tax=Anaerobacillus sp. MEB173 TaxID=3383345 RepID=UPI003F91BCAF